MTNPEPFSIDAKDDALTSLKLANEFFQRAKNDIQYWKWFILTLHSGVQGLFALALENGNGFLVQKPEVMKRILAVHDGKEALDPDKNYWHMDNFMRLYEKLKRKENLRFSDSVPIPPEEFDDAVKKLDWLRDTLVHFNVNTLVMVQADFIKPVKSCVELIAFLHDEKNRNFFTTDERYELTNLAIKGLRELT